VDVAFRLDLPHGRCVGVSIPDVVPQTALDALLPEERAHATTLSPARQPTWVAGRLALRAALDDLGLDAGPLLATDRGAPLLPAHAVGSISHKRALAVGLAAARADAELGVDLELVAPLRIDIARRVLTPDELTALGDAPSHEDVLLRLSCKEAIYKALDPYVRRYVAFHEATVGPRPDGTATAQLALPYDVDLAWRRIDSAAPYFLTSALIRPASAAGSR
jgi:enterobactin synthetase component D